MKISTCPTPTLIFKYVTREDFLYLILELLNGILSIVVKVKYDPHLHCLPLGKACFHWLALRTLSRPKPRGCASFSAETWVPLTLILRESGAASAQIAAKSKSHCQVSPKLRHWMYQKWWSLKLALKIMCPISATNHLKALPLRPSPHKKPTRLSVSLAWK